MKKTKRKYTYPLPSLKRLLTARRDQLNRYFFLISARQSKEEYGSDQWTRLNQALNVIRVELEQRALGK